MNKLKILIADDKPQVIKDIIMDMLPCSNNLISPDRRLQIVQEYFEVEFFNLAIEAEQKIKKGYLPDIALIDINFSDYTGHKKLTQKQRKQELTRFRGIDTIVFLKRNCENCIVAGYTAFGSESDIFNKIKEHGFTLSHIFDKSNPANTVYELHKGRMQTKGKKQPYLISHFFKDVLTFLAAKYYINLSSGSKKTITSFVSEDGRAGWRKDSEKSLLNTEVKTNNDKVFKLKHLLLCNAIDLTEDKNDPIVFAEVKELMASLKQMDQKAIVTELPVWKGDWVKKHIKEAFVDFANEYSKEHANVRNEVIKLVKHFFDVHCISETELNHEFSENFRCDSFINQKLTNTAFFKKFKNNIILRISLATICHLNNEKPFKYNYKYYRDNIINLFILFIDSKEFNPDDFKVKIENKNLYKQFFGRLGLSKMKDKQLIKINNLSNLEQSIVNESINAVSTFLKEHLNQK